MSAKDFLNPASFLAQSKLKNGLQYKHNFFVNLVTLPTAMKASPDFTLVDLQWNAIEVSVPGVSLGITTSNVAGRPRYYAHERADQDLSITFLEDSSMPARRFFEEWMKISFNPLIKTRKYPSQYQASQLNVNSMNQQGKMTYMDSFLDIFPFQIDDLDYSRSSYEMMKTKVTFKYKIHILENAQESNSSIQSSIIN